MVNGAVAVTSCPLASTNLAVRVPTLCVVWSGARTVMASLPEMVALARCKVPKERVTVAGKITPLPGMTVIAQCAPARTFERDEIESVTFPVAGAVTRVLRSVLAATRWPRENASTR